MKHILVVDDDRISLIICREALADRYKMSAACSGMEAIRFFEKNTCDLVLLDINMPNMNGFEVLEQLKSMENAKDVPVVFLTADSDAVIESQCFDRGAQDFIAKPFVKQVLCSRIGRILELNELRESLADKLKKKTLEVEEISSIAHKDVLTGLWNRNYMELHVNELLQEQKCGILFMMDLDRFKAINDRYGHLTGDHVLKIFAQILVNNSEEGELLGRLGGDEFVMFIPDQTDKKVIGERADQIISEMVDKIEKEFVETKSSVSIGIAVYPDDGEDYASLYNSADKALYHVKMNGKNSYHFYSDSAGEKGENSANMVDINYLKDLMLRSDVGNGAYQVDFGSFHHIYNFLQRFSKRTSREVYTLLFTLQYRTREEDVEESEEAIEKLEEAIYTSLRKVDVSTRYSNKQMIVILLDTNRENAEMVAGRILGHYRERYINKKIYFDVDIAKMEI